MRGWEHPFGLLELRGSVHIRWLADELGSKGKHGYRSDIGYE